MGFFVLSEPIVAAVLAALSVASPVQQREVDLTDLSLEDLMRMDVTVASRRSQPFQDVPAAAYIITEEDISRSGASSIPELLRGTPGLHVAQIDQSKWMVSSRGFNGRFANKLLVLVDGRSVYTPLFSGTYWNLIDIPLEEIERIEIVRGSGGSLWGTNAVNGTINIITKHAATTLGTYARIGTGTKEIQSVYAAVSDRAGHSGFFRTYVSGRRTLGTTTYLGTDAGDEWSDFRVGGRYDFSLSESVNATLDFSVSQVDQGMTLEVPTFTGTLSELQVSRHISSQLSTRFFVKRDLGEKGADAAQLYFVKYDLDNPEVGEDRSTVSVEFNSMRKIGDGHTVSFGAGYKTTSDKTYGNDLISFSPVRATLHYWSGFLSDQFALTPKLTADLMIKLESSSLADLRVLPTARLSYKRDPKTSFWVSSSQAMRTPSRVEQGIDIDLKHESGPGGLPLAYHLVGTNNMKPEMVESLEAGVRFQPNDDMYVDIAAFYSRYYDLRTFELGAQTVVNDPETHIRQEFVFGNMLNAETAGLEVSADWRLQGGARVTTAFSMFTERFRFDPGSTDPFTTTTNERSGITPKQQLTIRASIPLDQRSSFDVDMYSVSKLAWSGWGSYFRVDAQYSTKLSSGAKLSAGVRNLFADQHLEGRNALYEVPSRLPTQAYLNMSWRF